ncbi:MAG: hypothetical protein U9Q62_09505 [Campylobacterota bacterium]|nr:hypothetical protein [Campylobacterota bacterium]
MKEKFSEDFPKFKAKIHNFVVSQNFAAKVEYYDKLLHEMASVAPDDMKAYVERSPSFLPLRNKSLQIMEMIVDLHNDLDALFKMDEAALGAKFDHDLAKIDQKVAANLKEAANLIHQFEQVSEQGRKAIEQVDSPFFSQTL